MTILHVSTAISWRGGEQQVAYLLLELKKREIDQIVLCPENSVLAHFCAQNEIPVAHFHKRSGFDLLLALKITQLCRKYKKPVIHAHDSHAHTATVLSGLLWMNKTPVVIHRRVSFKLKKSLLSQFKYTYHHIKHIICVSQSVKEIIDQQYTNALKSSVIYDAIDQKKFENIPAQNYLCNTYNIEKQHIIIGNISALTTEKDLYTFIDTAEILLKENQNFHFFILGEGKEREKIQAYIEHKALQGKVILTGFIHNPYLILPEFDVFLFTSINEGLGTSILDAMACKVAVVATRAGGIPEIVKHNITGLCVEPKNASKLAEAVNQLITDQSLNDTLIQNAFEMLKDFSVSEMCEKTLEVYYKITGE